MLAENNRRLIRLYLHSATDYARNRRGKRIPGILEMLGEVGALTRIVDPGSERSDGWDLADAEAEGWGTADALAWLKNRLMEVRDAA